MPAVFETEKCKGCGLCVTACPKKIVVQQEHNLNKKGYSYAHCVDAEKCNSCTFCATICPDLVITVTK